MDAFQVVDALAASFFGLIGIWAAVVRRHWFLRCVVVSVFLLSTVLITAHEVAIEFGIQIALLMACVWIVRHRGDWQIRFSLETALLLMVVVAVTAAVLGKTRELSINQWIFVITTGICTAGYGMCSLWLVFGSARLRYRVPFAIFGIAYFLGLDQFSQGLRRAIRASLAGGSWQARLAEHYTSSNIVEWWMSNSRSVLLGSAIISTALLLGRQSGWFSKKSSQTPTLLLPLSARLSRVGLVLVFLGTASPLVYIFYRLLTPASFPNVEIVEPNGYDDIIAAGNMLDDNIRQLRDNCSQMNENELQEKLRGLEIPLQRIRLGLDRPSFHVRHLSQNTTESKNDQSAFNRVAMALLVEYVYLRRFGTTQQRIEWSLMTLQLGNQLSDAWEIRWPEQVIESEIRELLPNLNASECQYLIEKLEDHERNRNSLESYLQIRRIEAENSSWDRHLKRLLRVWSGQDPYLYDRWNYKIQLIDMRMLIAQLALQRYVLDHNKLPATLEELTPNYLSTVPIDPFSENTIQYYNVCGGYALISADIPHLSSPYIFGGPAGPYVLQHLKESWLEFHANILKQQRHYQWQAAIVFLMRLLP